MLEIQLFVAFSFILVISYFGWKLKSLTVSGAIGAVFVAFFIYVGFSLQGLILLGCFFGSSSFLSKFQHAKKSTLQDMLVKGDQRDIIQVWANGGVPALLGLIYSIGLYQDEVTLLFCIAIASANADTWASEIGTLSKQKPRLLLTLKRVERGTSGAVSFLGTCAALAGAFFIGIVGGLLFQLTFLSIVMITIFGFIGNIVDTLLGHTFQVKYKCKICEKITEKQEHCHERGKRVSKFGFLNNDAVNFLSIILSTSLSLFILS